MRLAIFHNLPPGGALRFTLDMAALLKTRHEIHVYTTEMSPEIVNYGHPTTPGAPTTRWNHRPSRIPSYSLGLLADAARLRLSARSWARSIDERSYDAVLLFSSQVTHAPPLLGWLRTPSIYFIHEPPRRSTELIYREVTRAVSVQGRLRRGTSTVIDALLGRIDRSLTSHATGLICNSFFSAENILRVYGRTAWVVHLGVDTDFFRPGTPRHEGDHEALLVGGIEPAKSADLAIRALAKVPPEHRPRLRIIGERADPRVRTALEEAARAADVKLVIETEIDDEILRDRYQTALFTLCLAYLEPFGLSAIESLACGTPVIAVREGGFRETVEDGTTGHLVERDAAEIARAVTSLSRESYDSAALHTRVTSRFSLEGATSRLEEALVRLLEPAGAEQR